MANFNKAFNFRGGFQVDTDTLVVRGPLVGIGSTIPQERLDVAGNIKADSIILTNSNIGINSGTIDDLVSESITVGNILIENGEITSTDANLVKYYGDGSTLSNLPTSQWLDIDVGLGYTSIYSAGNVGVDTTDPRYVFQVGGVPYPKLGLNLFQDGVGIEGGNIDVSGVVRTRGQFIGIGSLIEDIDASKIGINSISTERLPRTIVVDEVVAPKLTGVADTAKTLTSNAVISVSSIEAATVKATNRVLSPKVQVGNEDQLSTVGDIEVKKTTNTTIYSISDSSSRIFAGSQRPGGTARSYGGLRFGGNVSGDPKSGDNDLDIVNYDIGNLNFYLHSGRGNSLDTAGAFRWIYGVSDRIGMELSKEGKLSLSGNLSVSEPTLDVVGLVTVTGNSDVTGNSIIGGDLSVGGDLSISGEFSAGQLELVDLTVSGNLEVGSGPTLGGGGVNSVGVFSGTGVAVYNGASRTVDITGGGDITADGVVSATSVSAVNVSSTNLSATTGIVGPSFQVNASGLTASAANITTLDVGTLTAVDFTPTTLTANSANIGGVSIASNIVTSDTVNATTVTVSGTLSAATVSATDITSPAASIGNVTLSTISPVSGSVSVGATLSVTGDIEATGSVRAADLKSTSTTVELGGKQVEIIERSVGDGSGNREAVIRFVGIGQTVLLLGPID